MKSTSQARRLLTAAAITGAVMGTTGIAAAASGHLGASKASVKTKDVSSDEASPDSNDTATPAGQPKPAVATTAKKATGSPKTTTKPKVEAPKDGTKPTIKPSSEHDDEGREDANGGEHDSTPSPTTAAPRATTTVPQTGTTGVPATTTPATTAAATTTTAAATTTTTAAATTTTAKATTTTTAAATTTTTAPATTTTAAATTTTAKATTTTAAATTTTVKATTTTAAATTTTVAAPSLVLSQAFTAVKMNGVINLNTTITNNGGASANVSLTITMRGSLPHFLEAGKGSGWVCSKYLEFPTNPTTYTCTGVVAAHASSVVSVTSGSTIRTPATLDSAGQPNPGDQAVGGAISASASATPGNVIASTSAVYLA
jgi:hypothetical protein